VFKRFVDFLIKNRILVVAFWVVIAGVLALQAPSFSKLVPAIASVFGDYNWRPARLRRPGWKAQTRLSARMLLSLAYRF